MLNLTRREKSVIRVLVLLYIAGCVIFFGKKLLVKNNSLDIDKKVIENDFKQLVDKVDSTYFISNENETESSDEKIISLPVNINFASKKELITIKGIGPVTAEKIIEYRTINGKFNSIDELTKIHGIGEKTLERIKGEVTIE